ncbi:MAG: hypothetical protein WAV50_01615 [Minisyncoccia bacterium]
MALPTIPTSFVPHAALSNRRNVYTDFGNAFGLFAYILLAVIFVLAAGVFFYGRIQAANLAATNSALQKEEEAIDKPTVQGFVQLRDRLNSGRTLLSSHTAISNFFSVLQSLLPSTVRFTSLHLTIDTAGIAKAEGTGISKSFNALSVASGAFASDGRIKDVIFSKMSINRDSSISFGFSASIDPALISYTGSAPEVTAPATESSSTTTP